MKKVGIWIDRRNAKIISIKGGNVQFDTIVSNLEDFNVTGGSGTSVKGGPQDVVKERKYLEREKQQLSAFFQAIALFIADADAIVILGPAQTGEKLHAELSEKHTQLHNKVKSVEKADSMTDNQLIARVRDYYASDT